MSFYDVNNPLSFSVKNVNKNLTAIQDQVKCDQKTLPKIIYSNFSCDGLEFRMNPMNLNGEGQFVVEPIGVNQSFQFVLNEGYSRVLGMISFGGQYSVESVTPKIFRFNLFNLTFPFYGVVSLMIE